LTATSPVLKPAIMNTPESEIRMKTKASNFKWAAVAIAALAVGFVIGYVVFLKKTMTTTADQPASYILYFGDPTVSNNKVKVDVAAFQAALSSPAPRWCTDVVISGVPFTCPSSGLQPAVNLMQKFDVHEFDQDAGGAPCTMHVTQKVGLNDFDQVRRVLATIQKQ